MKRHVCYQNLFSKFWVKAASNGTCRQPAGQDGEQQKKNINRLSAGVKNEADKEKESISENSLFTEGIVINCNSNGEEHK